MTHSFVAYVDEAGCDGNRFGNGSTDFLVLSALVARVNRHADFEAIWPEVRATLEKPPTYPVRTWKRTGTQSHRYVICSKIAQKRLRAISVLTHKPSLTEAGWFDNPGDLYFFASKFLIERISWLARDNGPYPERTNGTVRIVFSENKALRYDRFRSHIRRLMDEPQHNCNAAWPHIDLDRIEARTHSDDDVGLLAVDYLASAMREALEYKKFLTTDDRFARLFRPITYSYNRRHIGYGIKLWPSEAEALIETDARLSWVRHYFK